MINKRITIISIVILLTSTIYLNFSDNVSANSSFLDGWSNSINGGLYFEKNGVITLSGDEASPGPVLVKEFNSVDDFELSFDLKAEALGELDLYPQGGGEGFNIKFCTTYGHSDPSVQFEMRARGGGQFLMVWHDKICDQNGWDCNWKPFVYNGLDYSNGYDYWHPNPTQDRSNSTVKPDVWYNIRIRVQKEPFIVTGEVIDEKGVSLGSYQVDSINNLTFDEINFCEMTTIQGGTFYLRNISGLSSNCSALPTPVTSPYNETEINPSPSPLNITSLSMFLLESNSTVTAFTFNNSSYELSFNVTGKSGTTGYVKLTISKTLMPHAQNLKLSLDGKQSAYTLNQTENSWIINFDYPHSTHLVSMLIPKNMVVNQPINPVLTLDQFKWIIATAFVLILIFLFTLLLFSFRNNKTKQQ